MRGVAQGDIATAGLGTQTNPECKDVTLMERKQMSYWDSAGIHLSRLEF